MRYLGLVSAIVLCVAAGCASTDDPPPWQRAGLAGGKIGEVLAKAAKDNDDKMTMSSDRDLKKSDFAQNPDD
jgi:hypothetical protein